MDTVALTQKINKLVKKYSLSQGVRVALTILKELYPDEEIEKLYERVRFKGNPSLSFAKSEIAKMEFVETDQGKNIEITVNFLSLFGAASPLPSHYSEMVLDSVDKDKVLEDFLNLFNHHIQKLIYPIWEKQRYYIQYRDTLQDSFSKYILSFLGLYSQIDIQETNLNFQKILPYVGLLSMKQKSAGTLVSILRHYFEHDEIEIVQCIPMNATIPLWQRFKLGQTNTRLGKDTHIGESVKTRSAKFQVLLNSINFDDLYAYSMHGEKMKELQELMDLALSEPLEHELCLGIEQNDIEPFKLSEHYLGINCFLGLPKGDTKIILAKKEKDAS